MHASHSNGRGGNTLREEAVLFCPHEGPEVGLIVNHTTAETGRNGSHVHLRTRGDGPGSWSAVWNWTWGSQLGFYPKLDNSCRFVYGVHVRACVLASRLGNSYAVGMGFPKVPIDPFQRIPHVPLGIQLRTTCNSMAARNRSHHLVWDVLWRSPC